MYEVPEIGALLSQGDILEGPFAFPYSPDPGEEIQIVRGDEVLPEAQVENAWQDGSEVILMPSQRSRFAIILSNSCDAETEGGKDPLEFLTMGAIFALTTLPDDGKRGDCRKNRFVRFHYLEAIPDRDFPESYVHFGLTALVRQEAILEAKAKRIRTLASPYRESLGHRLGEFFSRVALP